MRAFASIAAAVTLIVSAYASPTLPLTSPIPQSNVVTHAAHHARSLTTIERATLQVASTETLGTFRAGAPAAHVSLDQLDRSALHSAVDHSRNLEQLRAGYFDMSDRDMTLIALTALAVVVLIIVL